MLVINFVVTDLFITAFGGLSLLLQRSSVLLPRVRCAFIRIVFVRPEPGISVRLPPGLISKCLLTRPGHSSRNETSVAEDTISVGRGYA